MATDGNLSVSRGNGWKARVPALDLEDGRAVNLKAKHNECFHRRSYTMQCHVTVLERLTFIKYNNGHIKVAATRQI